MLLIAAYPIFRGITHWDTAAPSVSQATRTPSNASDKPGPHEGGKKSREVYLDFRELSPGNWSAEDYDRYVPLLCEAAAHEYRRGRSPYILAAYYDWVTRLNPELSRGPLKKVLEGDDVGMIGAAAYYVAILGLKDTTPLLIDALMRKQRGRNVDDLATQSYFLNLTTALGVYAAQGEERAATFLLESTRPDAWRSAEMRILGLQPDDTARRMAWWTVNALTYWPSEESLAAIEASADIYEHTQGHIDVIRAYLRSGDTLENYHRELTLKGHLDNKYYHSPKLDRPLSRPHPRELVTHSRGPAGGASSTQK